MSTLQLQKRNHVSVQKLSWRRVKAIQATDALSCFSKRASRMASVSIQKLDTKKPPISGRPYNQLYSRYNQKEAVSAAATMQSLSITSEFT